MPPVQIPDINRFQDTNEPSVGRVDARVPDFAAAVAPQEKAAAGLVEGGAETYIKYVRAAADTEGTRAANDIHQFMENALEGPDGAKKKTGDPAVIYKQFDDDTEKKAQELRDKYKDANSETQAAVEANIAKTKAKFYDRRTSAYGNQKAAYEKSVTDNGVVLAKNDMMDATAHLDISDPNTLVPLENTRNQIFDLRVKNGLKQGTVREIKNEKGDVTGYDMDPSVKVQIAKDTSDGLHGAIENLNASGDVEGAKFLMEKYGGYLLPDQKAKLTEKTQKVAADVQGRQEFDKVRGLPPEQASAQLDKIQDPKVRDKAQAEFDTYQRRMQNVEARSSKKNYQAVANLILDKQKSGEPFQDINDMMNDPTVKRVWDNIKDPKQKIALQHQVMQPRDSDPDQLNNAYQKLFKGEFQGMSPDDFNEAVAGLNKSDRSRMTTQWMKFNSQTPSQELQMTKNMGSQLAKELNVLGYVKKNDFGKYDNKNQNKITAANAELVESLDKLGPLTPQEQVKWVKQFAADKVKGDVFQKDKVIPLRLQGQITPTTTTTTTTQPTTTNVQGVQPSVSDTNRKRAAQQQFKKENNRWPVDGVELDKYMKKNGL